ncbi:MAG: PadR family transcriptional regulator [Planctomycetota bacterium]|jgi:PadR family transcriptional regulator PadR
MGGDDNVMRSWITQLRKGVVELAILNLLRQAESYGYELTQRCAEIPGLELKEATLYQVLARLCESGSLKTREERTSRLRKRTFFSLTSAGQRRVMEMNQHLDGMVAELGRLREQGE